MTLQQERRSQKPIQIKTEDFRTYLVVHYGALLGLIAHACFIPLFWSLNLPYLALLNVFSVIAWLYARSANERGKHSIAINLIALEVWVHAVAATYFLGWQSGFSHYLPTLIVFVMFNRQMRNGAVIAEALIIVSTYAALYALAEPRTTVERTLAVLPILNVANTVISFSTLALISFYFREASLINERHFESLAHTDALTQLPNRRALWRKLERECERADRQKTAFTIAIADIDQFKPMNDSFGHDFGDTVLKQISSEFRACLREGDEVGRWGGEEFLFIWPNATQAEALATAERIRQHIEQLVLEGASTRLNCTISIGIAEHAAGEDIYATLARADDALYQAKNNGRNQTIVGTKRLV